MKKVPRFWWDFDSSGDEFLPIVLQSDDPEHKIIGYCRTIEDAEHILKCIREGRIDYRKSKLE